MDKLNSISLIFIFAYVLIKTIDIIVILYLLRFVKKHSLYIFFLIKSSILSIETNIKPALANKIRVKQLLPTSFYNNRNIPFGKFFYFVRMEVRSHA